jgi:hypothetical protein
MAFLVPFLLIVRRVKNKGDQHGEWRCHIRTSKLLLGLVQSLVFSSCVQDDCQRLAGGCGSTQA